MKEQMPIFQKRVEGESEKIERFKQKFLNVPYGNLTEEQQAMLRTHVENSSGKWDRGDVSDVYWDEKKKRITVSDPSGESFYYEAYISKPEKVKEPILGGSSAEIKTIPQGSQEHVTSEAARLIEIFTIDFAKGKKNFKEYIERSNDHPTIKISTIIQTMNKILDKIPDHPEEMSSLLEAIGKYYREKTADGSFPALYYEQMDRAIETWREKWKDYSSTL